MAPYRIAAGKPELARQQPRRWIAGYCKPGSQPRNACQAPASSARLFHQRRRPRRSRRWKISSPREAPLQPPSGPNAFVRHWGTHTGQPQQFCRPRRKDALAALAAQFGVRVELSSRSPPPLPPQSPPGLAKLHAAPQHTKLERPRAGRGRLVARRLAVLPAATAVRSPGEEIRLAQLDHETMPGARSAGLNHPWPLRGRTT